MTSGNDNESVLPNSGLGLIRRANIAGADEWVSSQTLTAYGVRVGVRTNKPEFLDKLMTVLANVWRPSSSQTVERLFSLRIGTGGIRRNGRIPHKLFEDRQLVAMSMNIDEALEMFESQMKLYLAERAKRRVFVHAGVVGWQGQAIVIPGRSYTGKTSLVAELVRAGAEYYSDEYAVLDDRGRVHPYSTPLAIREPGSYRQRRCLAAELGGGVGVTPLPVGLIVVSRYQSGKQFKPRPLSGGQTVLELLANALPARRKPAAVMTALRQAVTGAVSLKGERGEAAETADLIFNYLRRSQITRRS
jgi:hypothetical protein